MELILRIDGRKQHHLDAKATNVDSTDDTKSNADHQELMNALTVMIGNAQLLVRQLERLDGIDVAKARTRLLSIIESAWKAAELVRSRTVESSSGT